jgi:threonine dehydrogenase-like Zn-dependent dehydrogenase
MNRSEMETMVGTATMKAMVLEAPGRVTPREVPLPEPGEGEVRIRIEGTGVCASNLSPWGGQPWFEYPFAPGAMGHEGWGTVDALGPGVASLERGQRVAALSGGAYAEYDIVPADHVVPLPAALDGRPFPGEPLGCAVNIFRRSRIVPGATVAIVGIGFLGALLTRLASHSGARVIGISRRPFSLEVGKAFGAAETIEMNDHHRVVDRVRDLTGGTFCDVVIEAVGQQWPLDLSAEITRERGTLVVAGYHQDGPRQVNMQLWNWRGLDVVNAHERDPAVYIDGMRRAVDLVASGVLDPDPLYTHTFPLARLGDALDATRDRPDGFLKALVTP